MNKNVRLLKRCLGDEGNGFRGGAEGKAFIFPEWVLDRDVANYSIN